LTTQTAVNMLPISPQPNQCPATVKIVRNALDYPVTSTANITFKSLVAATPTSNEVLTIKISTNNFYAATVSEKISIQFSFDGYQTNVLKS
jgi:hypothetical protein